MQLPNVPRRIDRSKLIEYLLNPEHPKNGGKAVFFGLLGYGRESWPLLKKEFDRFGRTAPVISMTETGYGRKYIQEGFIRSTSHFDYGIRIIWIHETDTREIRLVTAYPADVEEGGRPNARDHQGT